MKPTIDWTPAQVDELISLWRQGRTSYELAAHFNVTRNSIMGKLHREKLRRAETDPIERRAVANTGTITKRRYTRREAMLTLPSSAGSVMRIVEPAPTPPDQGQLASIVDVTGCRWPVADNPDFIGGVAFCNHEQRDGSPYCPYHARENVAPYSREAIRRTIKQSLYLLKVAS
jgi:GcrA cell cycle regulator